MVCRSLRWLVCALALAASAAHGAGPLAWFDGGRPTVDAVDTVEVLRAAVDEGLDPDDYQAAALASALARARQDAPLPAAEQSQVDAALTAAAARYLADVQRGRVDPRQLHSSFPVIRRAPAGGSAVLHEALANRRVAQALRDAQPRLPMYASLRDALARYRALADDPAWQVALPPLPGRKVMPGQRYAGLPLLAQRLAALGDLPPDGPVPARLEGALVPALQAFQERHGLAPDGVLGPATLQQLNVPPARRARQIELALERLRWTPFMQGPRMIVINAPEFVLRAYEVNDGRIDVHLAMRVIVGKAMRNRTPLLGEDLRSIEFSPYWNVPPSIARAETVPRLRRDPGYLQREGLEFVTASGQVVTTVSAANLDAVLHGGWRIRQRPGPRNALGGVKFVFPNGEDIYLHDTPARQLFGRARRDFSHGCIRVEAPVSLAQFALQGEPGWSEERIREAMALGTPSTVALRRPIPVLIAYSTVVVRGGKVFFYPDLYREDALLERALRLRSDTAPGSFPTSRTPG